MARLVTAASMITAIALLAGCARSSAPAAGPAPEKPASSGPAAGTTAEKQPPAAEKQAPAAPAAAPAVAQDSSLASCPPRQPLLRVGGVFTGEFSPHPMEARFSDTHYTRLHQLPLFGADPLETKLDAAYGAAESWEFAPGAQSLKVKLWKGLTFNNGDPVTAEDVKFSVEAASSDFADPQLTGIMKAFGAKAQVVDELTIQIEFKNAAVTFPIELSPLVYPLIVVSKKSHSNGEITQQSFDAFREKPAAAGPYQVVSREVQKNVILTAARKDPLLGCPTYDRVEVRHIPEMGTRMAQLQTGQIDIAQGERDLIDQAKGFGAKTASKADANIIGLYIFQTHLPQNVFRDVRVRQAAAYAIDHELIARTIWKGEGVVPWGCTWPPPTEISAQDPAYVEACGKPYPYDPNKAKELLAAAGYGPSNRPPAKLVFNVNYPEEADLAQAMQPMLNAVGFDAQVEPTDRAERDRRRNQEGLANNILFFGPGGRATALAGAYSVYGPGQGFGPKDDPELEQALARASSATTEADYKKAMADIGRIVHDKAYGPGFFSAGSIWFLSSKIPDWGLEKSIGRAPLNLAALVTKRS
jgi:peptide/nickel transport system substrate-binding protein